MRVLNRVVTWTEEGIEYEVGQRHGELIATRNGTQGREPRGESRGGQGHLGGRTPERDEGEEATRYRAMAAQANFLALDRADIGFAKKELCRGMANQQTGDGRD